MVTATTRTDLQLDILRQLYLGKDNAITGKMMANLLGLRGTRSIRLAIVELRHQGQRIIGCNKGYFIAETLEEIQEARRYLRSYIKDLCIDLRDLKFIARRFAGQQKMKL